MDSRIERLLSLRAPAISLAAAATFFALARVTAAAPPLAVWGGAAWVFLLSMIVTLPLFAGRGGERAG